MVRGSAYRVPHVRRRTYATPPNSSGVKDERLTDSPNAKLDFKLGLLSTRSSRFHIFQKGFCKLRPRLFAQPSPILAGQATGQARFQRLRDPVT